MGSRSSDNEWEKLGRHEPYYGVLPDDRFRKDQLNQDSLDAFFQSGRDHIDFVLQTVHASMDPAFSPSRALDFGCGVGRCTIPLALVCRSVVGVDISDSMLKEARRNCLKRSIANVDFVRSDDRLDQLQGVFDFIHSFLVFQHIPPERGEVIFEKIISLLADRGIATIQFLYSRRDSPFVRAMGSARKSMPLWHSISNLVYGKSWSEPLMEKNVYDLNRLLVTIRDSDCGNLCGRFFDQGNLQSIILFFQKVQDTYASSQEADALMH